MKIRIIAKDFAAVTIEVEGYAGRHSFLVPQTLEFTVNDAHILLGESSPNYASNFFVTFNPEGKKLRVDYPGNVTRMDFEEMKDEAGIECLDITLLYK